MRFMRGFLVVMTLLGAGGGVAQTADAPGPPRELRDVKVEQRATAAAVTVATSGAPKYETTRLDSPVRLMIDISGRPRAGSHWTDVPEPLTEVRGSQLTPGTARLVVELNRKAGYRIEERPQGLTVLIDAPARAGDDRDLPAVEAGLRGPGRSFRECPRRRSRPMRRRPPAPKANEPTRAEWKPGVPMLATSTTAPSIIAPDLWPVHPAALARVVVAQAATTPAPAAPAPAAPNGSKLITLEFKDADVINLLRILSAESGRNIVAGDDVKGKLSVSLRNVTWEQALDTILEVKGLQKIDKGGVIRIVSTEQLAKEREALARADDAKRKAEIDARTKEAEAQLKEADVANRRLQAELAAAEAQSRGPLREEVIRLSYADPEDVAKTLQGILGIPAEGAQPIAGTQGIAAPGGPLIAEPPFSALYGARPAATAARGRKWSR